MPAMIFGFNTDVKQDEVVYHVQSEAHQSTQLLLTTVFVQGRCVGKRSTSYASDSQALELADDEIHELLKDQHLYVIEAIKEGKIEVALASGT